MKSALWVIFLVIGLSGPAFAQHEVNPGPRGGKLKTVSSYRMEVVECYEFLEIYLYDLDMYAIRNNGLKGSVTFFYPDSSRQNSVLFLYGADGFTAEVKQQCYEYCEVEIYGVGLNLKATFNEFGEENEDCRKPEQGHPQK